MRSSWKNPREKRLAEIRERKEATDRMIQSQGWGGADFPLVLQNADVEYLLGIVPDGGSSCNICEADEILGRAVLIENGFGDNAAAILLIEDWRALCEAVSSDDRLLRLIEKIIEQKVNPPVIVRCPTGYVCVGCRYCEDARERAEKYPDLIGEVAGLEGLEGLELAQAIADAKYGGVLGTDQCACIVRAGAIYPACPHDISGSEGTLGPTGATDDQIIAERSEMDGATWESCTEGLRGF